MKKRVFAVLVAISSLLLGAGTSLADPPQWQKDPDLAIDSAGLTSVITQLVAPDATIGDTDTAAMGVGADPVGVDDLTVETTDSAHTSSGTTRYVDDTPLDNDCPPTTFTSIQAAVNASGAGDTVKVCPGTYTEQVRIGTNKDGLRLESVKPLQAIIKWPAVESPPLALVDINGSNRVSVRGFKITGPFTFPGCSPIRHEGVLIESAFDARISFNWITMIQNSSPAFFGCQEGDAVSVGHRTDPQLPSDQPGSAEIDHNRIDEYQKNGVQAVNSGTSLHADYNVITASANPAIHAITASNGVVVFRMAAGVVDHNVISKNKFTSAPLSTGVVLDQAPSGSSRIDHNLIFDNDYGIETDTQNNLEISHNGVFRNRADAITLCGDVGQGCGMATGIVVRSNDVQNNGGIGISLLGADNNLLKSNHVDRNGTGPADTTDGIRVDSGSTGNVLASNNLAGNVFHDCHDDSTGTRTAGTGNTWKDNHGQTQNRPGLCEPKHHDGGGDDDDGDGDDD